MCKLRGQREKEQGLTVMFRISFKSAWRTKESRESGWVEAVWLADWWALEMGFKEEK